jgi:hypothetical protein
MYKRLQDFFKKYKKGIYSTAILALLALVFKKALYDRILPISDAMDLL